MYDRILVPTDGSATAQQGRAQALALARRLDATVVLLHVVEPYPYGMEFADADTWESLLGGMREQARALMASESALAASAGVKAETLVIEAPGERVCDVIVAQARQQRCDLIVIGTHGRRGVSHALLGSDAERVLRLSPVPVLSVRASAP